MASIHISIVAEAPFRPTLAAYKSNRIGARAKKAKFRRYNLRLYSSIAQLVERRTVNP